MIKNDWLVAVIVTLSQTIIPMASAQDGPEKWEKAIAKFEAADQEKPPTKGSVLFLGSSSIRGWDLKQWFPDQDYLNRGFGGSEISDSIHYFDRLVTPYQPRAIVFYAGDNDIAKGKSPRKVFEDFQEFARLTAKTLPKTKIIFVAIKPSISRWNLVDKMRNANKLIRDYAKTNSNIVFADIDSPMIGTDGKPKKELFQKDGLHLNSKGYRIWSDIVGKRLGSVR